MDKEYLITQETFRILLKAISHPGRIFSLKIREKDIFYRSEILSHNPGLYLKPNLDIISSFTDELKMILKTLLDQEVSFFVSPYDESFASQVSSLTFSQQTSIEIADFIIFLRCNRTHDEIVKAKIGSLEYPDESATVIYLVESFEKNKDSVNFKLKGPGIKDELNLSIYGISKNDLLLIKEMNSEFPLGVDCIFLDENGNIICIPRSTKIFIEEL